MSANEVQLPRAFVLAVLVICVLPILLNLIGISFGAEGYTLDQELLGVAAAEAEGATTRSGALDDALHRSLTGSMIHTIVEWVAFCAAVFTVLLAFVHYGIARDVTTPIIGTALLCAGTMDAFHTLAADRLISAVADNEQFIPFTWAISRIFNAGILIVGAGLFLVRAQLTGTRRRSGGLRFVLLISLLFGLISYAVIQVCATSARLPQTVFPDQFVKRPWDILPLLMFLAAGGFVFPRFHRMYPSLFSHALLVGVMPAVATQLHAAFGSTTLYDNHFNIAHFLKIVAYAVPLIGLVLDYSRTYRAVERTNERLRREIVARKQAEAGLARRAEELARSNADLEQFAYAASHDLQEPLRAVASYLELLQRRYKGRLDGSADKFITRAVDAAGRMRHQISDLLEYARLTTRGKPFKQSDCSAVFDRVLEDLKVAIDESGAVVTHGDLPTVTADTTQLTRLFQNLIGNAIKFRGEQPPRVQVKAQPTEGGWLFSVRDNGIGIDPEQADRIFLIFQRLHTRREYPGTGIGLALCKKIVERHGGRIWVESEPGEGATFYFTIPNGRDVGPDDGRG